MKLMIKGVEATLAQEGGGYGLAFFGPRSLLTVNEEFEVEGDRFRVLSVGVSDFNSKVMKANLERLG